MKTKLISVPDWNSRLREIGWDDAPTAGDIENRVVRELTRGKVTFVDAGNAPIENGFRVTLHTESALPKFNRDKVTVTVGSGLYDRTVEERLSDMRVGDSAQVTVKDEPVCFTVLKAEKKHVPELTDEMVHELSIEGVDTLPAYRAYMARKIKTAYASGLLEQLLEQLVSASVFSETEGADIEKVIDLEYAPLNARFGLDRLTPEEWKNDLGRTELKAYYEQIYPDVAIVFGTTGKDSFYEVRREPAIRTIRECLVMNACLGSDVDPTEEPNAKKTLTEAFTNRITETVFGGE